MSFPLNKTASGERGFAAGVSSGLGLGPDIQPRPQSFHFATQGAFHAGMEDVRTLAPMVLKAIRAGAQRRTAQAGKKHGGFPIRPPHGADLHFPASP